MPGGSVQGQVIFRWRDAPATILEFPLFEHAERTLDRVARKLFTDDPIGAEALYLALRRTIPKDFAYRFPKEWTESKEETHVHEAVEQKKKAGPHADHEHRLIASQAICARSAFALEKLEGQRYIQAADNLDSIDPAKLAKLTAEDAARLDKERRDANVALEEHHKKCAQLQLAFAELKQKVKDGAKVVIEKENDAYEKAASEHELSAKEDDSDGDGGSIFAKVDKCLKVHMDCSDDKKKPEQNSGAGERTCDVAYFLKLREIATAAQSTLTKLFEEKISLGSESKVKLMLPPAIKSAERCMEKAMNDYNGNFQRLVDLSRGSIVCEDLDSLRNVLAQVDKMRAKGDIKIHRLKNRLKAPAPGGYRDLMINFSMPRRNAICSNHICELQIHLRKFFDIKNGEGHKLYELVRTLGLTTEEQSSTKVLSQLLPEKAGKSYMDLIMEISSCTGKGKVSEETFNMMTEADRIYLAAEALRRGKPKKISLNLDEWAKKAENSCRTLSVFGEVFVTCCRELVKNQGTKIEVLGFNEVQETKELSCSTSMEIAKVFFAPELEKLKFQGALPKIPGVIFSLACQGLTRLDVSANKLTGELQRWPFDPVRSS